MSIEAQQNTQPYIHLLKASSFTYSRAKYYGTIRVIIATAAIVIAPFIETYSTDAAKATIIIAVAGGILTLISELWLDDIEDNFKEQGAKIQEEFDTGLFAIPWNEIYIGEPVTPEIVAAACRSYKGNYKFADWYPDTKDVPYPLDVLMCQRASLVWDWRLREHFASAIVVVTVLWSVALLLFGFYKHPNFAEYVLSMILPAMPAFSQVIKARRGHLENVTQKKELQQRVSHLWQHGLNDLASVTSEDCRRIQDRIFDLRQRGPMVPDKWFKHLREQYEAEMIAASKKLREDALNKFAQHKETPNANNNC